MLCFVVGYFYGEVVGKLEMKNDLSYDCSVKLQDDLWHYEFLFNDSRFSEEYTLVK